MYYFYEGPSEKKLRDDNEELQSNYNILNRRLDYCMKIMDNIKNRDDNFYRVMMQLDPMTRGQSYAGLENEMRYKNLKTLTDAGLISLTSKRIDLLERELYMQSVSFDQLKENAERQKDKLAHIPSVLPIKKGKFRLSSGYGIRRASIEGTPKFHTGIDFAAREGTPVLASADGIVIQAERDGGVGNIISIDHGYNYITRYQHLNDMNVVKGQRIKKGDRIGTVGSTGKTSSPNLHYEVEFKGEAQNPVNYFFGDLTPEEYAEMVKDADDAGNVLD